MTWAQIVSFYKKFKVFIIGGILLLVLVALILFLWQTGSNYFFNRDIDKKKANVNAALAEANKLEGNVNIDKAIANQIVQNVNIATQEHLDSINATDHQRAVVNAAVKRMQEAANANRNVNAEDVEGAMQGL